MAKVVYILGAGASAGSLPTVKEIPLFFELFRFWIYWSFKNPRNDPWPSAYKGLYDFFMFQIEESKKYPSPDTYARVLKLKKEHTDYKKFNTFLSLFFLWKEVIMENKFAHSEIEGAIEAMKLRFSDGSNTDSTRMLENLKKLENTYRNTSIYDKFSYNIDPRYFGFFSTILNDSDEKEISKDVGIISWNYDTQIERTLLELNATISAKNYIKLNGNVKFKEIHERDFYTKTTTDRQLFGIMASFEKFESEIQYSWDHEEGENDDFFRDLFKDTEKVIIIGYSFPIYNRITDTNIFNILRQETAISRLDFPNIQIVGKTEDTYKKQKNSLKQLLHSMQRNIRTDVFLHDINFEDYISFDNSPDQFPIPPEIDILGDLSAPMTVEGEACEV